VEITKKRLLIGILWPSFWVAILLSGIIFSIIDPLDVTHIFGLDNTSPLAAYSIGFFFFWAVSAWNSFFSIIFSRSKPK